MRCRLAELPTRVERRARSFVVRVPHGKLPLTGAWRVRLASGVANQAGTALRAPQNALPGGARVHNVAFRSHRQEAGLVCLDGSRPPIDGSKAPSLLCGKAARS